MRVNIVVIMSIILWSLFGKAKKKCNEQYVSFLESSYWKVACYFPYFHHEHQRTVQLF